jgi:hypothetical protein
MNTAETTSAWNSPRPKHLERGYAEQFQDQCVVDVTAGCIISKTPK